MGVTHAALCSSGRGKPYCDCGAEVRALREELAEAKKFKDGMLDVLGGACPNDHRSTPFEEFKGCTPCLRAELAEARRDAERYRWLRSDDCPFSCYEQEGPDNWGWCPTSSRDLDEAIDAAMAGDSAPESAATATRL